MALQVIFESTDKIKSLHPQIPVASVRERLHDKILQVGNLLVDAVVLVIKRVYCEIRIPVSAQERVDVRHDLILLEVEMPVELVLVFGIESPENALLLFAAWGQKTAQ